VSRCIETVILEDEDMDESVLDAVVGMEHRDFQTVVYPLSGRLENHDVLYKLVDLYLKVSHVSFFLHHFASYAINFLRL
jgi:hypothetical protein